MASDVDLPPSPERRALMARIRAKDTKPEWIVRKLLHRAGYRYRLHVTNLPGRPDIVFGGRRKVVFVHGCFWHQHNGCKHARIPKTRVNYWKQKFEANRKRDANAVSALARMGWETIAIWECETGCPEAVLPRLRRFLDLE